MADTVTFSVYNGAAWTDQGAGEYVRFGGDGGVNANVSLDTYNRYLSFSDAGGSIVVTGQATTYDTPTTVELNGAAAVTLNTANVGNTDTCVRFEWTTDGIGKNLENVKFFAYSGDVATPPPNVTVVAFFRESGSIIKDGPVASDGKAWNNSFGVGGNAAALTLHTNRGATETTHYYYIGISAKASASGDNSFSLAMEYDVV